MWKFNWFSKNKNKYARAIEHPHFFTHGPWRNLFSLVRVTLLPPPLSRADSSLSVVCCVWKSHHSCEYFAVCRAFVAPFLQSPTRQNANVCSERVIPPLPKEYRHSIGSGSNDISRQHRHTMDQGPLCAWTEYVGKYRAGKVGCSSRRESGNVVFFSSH